MKTRRPFILMLVLFSMLLALSAFALPAQAKNGAPPPGTETLDDTEIHHLLFIREEEKLAHDVYVVLYEKWGLPIFANIAESEQRHTDAMAALLNYYGIEDPYIEGIGSFSDPYIAELYVMLTEWGFKSDIDAILVGAFIEEYDILDIWLAKDETDEERIQDVYVNLYEGSYSHLSGFADSYEKLTGQAYDVDNDAYDLLTQEQYDYVMSCVDKAPKGPDKDE